MALCLKANRESLRCTSPSYLKRFRSGFIMTLSRQQHTRHNKTRRESNARMYESWKLATHRFRNRKTNYSKESDKQKRLKSTNGRVAKNDCQSWIWRQLSYPLSISIWTMCERKRTT